MATTLGVIALWMQILVGLCVFGKTILGPNEQLTEGNVLDSGNGYYTKMQPDGNLVVYVSHNFVPKNHVWSSGTDGRGSSPYRLFMQPDNNLVIYDGFNNAIWQTDTDSRGTLGAYLWLQTDGNLVVYDGNGNAIWQAGSYNYDCHKN
eukprot:172436_1